MYSNNPLAEGHMRGMGIVFDLRTPEEYAELFARAYGLQNVGTRQIGNPIYPEGNWNREVGTLFAYVHIYMQCI